VNYTELRQAILDYTANDDPTFASNIDLFIKAAEKRIYAAADLPAESFEATSNLVVGDKYLTLPSGFLSTEEFAVVDNTGNYSYLINCDVSFIRECYPNPSTTGLPKHFALFDEDVFILGPTPDQGYAVELHYTAFPETIVTATTTWLGSNYEHVLLYGALVEAYTFMKGDEDVLKQYASLLADGVAALKEYAAKAGSDIYGKAK